VYTGTIHRCIHRYHTRAYTQVPYTDVYTGTIRGVYTGTIHRYIHRYHTQMYKGTINRCIQVPYTDVYTGTIHGRIHMYHTSYTDVFRYHT